jgi:hypothetical protein
LSVGYQKEILQADKSIKGKSSGLPFMLEKSGSVLSGFDGNLLMQSLQKSIGEMVFSKAQ